MIVVYADYPLRPNGSINRWLLSRTKEALVPYERTTMSYEGNLNRWLTEGFAIHENPARQSFVAYRRAISATLPDGIAYDLSNRILCKDWESEWEWYVPWENEKVERPGFWYVPTHLLTWAQTMVCTDSEHSAEWEVVTSGRAVVWLNGQIVTDFAPFTRNQLQSYRFQAKLSAGKNHMVVMFEDVAERDTEYGFILKYKGDAPLRVALPMDPSSPESEAEHMERCLANAYFSTDTLTEGKLYLHTTFPLNHSREAVIRFADKSGVYLKKEIVMNSHDTSTLLADISELRTGIHYIQVSIGAGRMTFTKRLFLQVYPAALLDEPIPREMPERKRMALHFIADHGAASVHKAYAMVMTGQHFEEAAQLIDRELHPIRSRHDCSDFSLITVLRLWYDARHRDIVDSKLWDAMRHTILHYRYWIDEPGNDVMWFFSENHALIFHTCELLAGQLFPDDIFPNSGLTGVQHQLKAQQLLLEWFARFEQEGLAEWNSNAYIPINVLGLLNLYDHAEPAVLKEKAKSALDTLFQTMAIHSLDGVMSCSQGRTYEKELKGSYVNQTSALAWITWGTGYLNTAASATATLCTSEYEPPGRYAKWARLSPGSAYVFQQHQGPKPYANLYTYKSAYGMLTSATDFRPGQPGYQEHVVHATIGPEAIVWMNHPGEWNRVGYGRPGYWAGNGTLPKVGQYRGLSVVLFGAFAPEQLPFTHAYFPTFAFDAWVTYGNWAIAKRGDAYLACYAVNGIELVQSGQNRKREIISPHGSSGNAWLLRISDVTEFADFASFTSVMTSLQIEVHTDLSVQFDDPRYGKVQFSWNGPFQVDGHPIEYQANDSKGRFQWIDLLDTKEEMT